MKQMWWVYMLQSVKHGYKSDGVLYIGVTTNIGRRIRQHNAGKGAKFTRGRGPWDHLACHAYKTRGAALKVEARLKRMSHAGKYEASAEPRRPQDYDPWAP